MDQLKFTANSVSFLDNGFYYKFTYDDNNAIIDDGIISVACTDKFMKRHKHKLKEFQRQLSMRATMLKSLIKRLDKES